MAAVTDAAAAGSADTADQPAAHTGAALGGVAVAVIIGSGLVACALAGALPLLVAVAVVQAVLAPAWLLGTAAPGIRGGLLLAGLAAAGADVAASVFPHGRLGALVAVLALLVPVEFVHQLWRGTARVHVVSSLSAVSVVLIAEVGLASLLQLRHEVVGASASGRAVAAACAAIATALVVGQLVDLVFAAPRFDPDVPRGLPAVLASAAGGAAVGLLVLRDVAGFPGGRPLFVGAALGALAGLLAVGASFVLHSTEPVPGRAGRALRPVIGVTLPFAVLSPVAFLLCLAVQT